MIYASRYYSTALLEKLVYMGEMPPEQYFIEITIPHGVSYEVVVKDHLPGWCEPDKIKAREFGSKWFEDRRSAILIVPSVVARMDENVLINPNHPHFNKITHTLETRVPWDDRLFE